ncbi:cytochrome c oxidase subunit II [Paucibacter sp. R3-3]|uniref:cytochrome-c oxidase n=1 Tax=Roseateles agri TaxID=3098619 RepID=A0ABU5DRQ2_9BURK|nr:cytochrome c oxidase subunit II [Paucibacter sp. R3-3]MDY0747717.1 cytochrome c oxidase subunit II [Paucibacter sp. R3-3]
MNGSEAPFELLAPAASTAAPRTDLLFLVMLVICGAMALLLAGLIAWFALRYREGSGAGRAHPPSHANGLEAAWTAVPMLLFIVLFGWAAHDYALERRVPADALPVYVVAKQWMWRLQHGENGRQEINELHVPLNRPVVLVLASQDVIHSFFVPAFRVKQDVVPGRYARLWFSATRLGEFRILCSEYCGSQHSAMLGRVIVMRDADYAKWLASGPPPTGDPTPQQLGQALYQRLACASCHAPDSSVHAPPLAGLYGRTVVLQDGGHVTADEDYLRESIVAPDRRLVAGQPAIMPSYGGQLSEQDVQNLVAYLREFK